MPIRHVLTSSLCFFFSFFSGVGECWSAGCQHAGLPVTTLPTVLQENPAQKEEGERKRC